MFKMMFANVPEDVNSCLSCPPPILRVIRDVARWCGSSGTEGLTTSDAETLLLDVESFDAKAWLESLQLVSTSSFDLDKRKHIAYAYKAAVKIYIIRATIPVPGNPGRSLEDLVSEVISHLSTISPDDFFFKAICWPLFMAGAETNDFKLHAWVIGRFEEGFKTLPWGYLESAIDLLRCVWEDKSESGETDGEQKWQQ